MRIKSIIYMYIIILSSKIKVYYKQKQPSKTKSKNGTAITLKRRIERKSGYPSEVFGARWYGLFEEERFN